MSICMLVDTKRQVAYSGIRTLKSTTGKTVDHAVDWSDLQNPDLNAMLMDPERAKITQDTLRIMGYETEIVTMSQDAKPNWLFYGAVAVLVGYIAATMLT